MWFVPPMLRLDQPGAQVISATLQKYVIVMVTRGQLDKTTGTISFQDIDTLQAMDQAGKQLKLVARNDLPPITAGMIATIESMLRQAGGAMGKGMKMFVFESGAVNSCAKGELSIPFAGETYTWETPVPGCPNRDRTGRSI